MTNKSLIGRLLLLSLLLLPSKVFAQISTTTCPGAGCVTQNTAGQGSVGVQVTGTFVGTITFYGSIDNSNYVAINLFAPTSAAGVSTTTTTGIFSGSIAGLSSVRIAFTAYTSGSATITIRTQQSAKAGGIGGSGGGSCAALAANNDVLYVSSSLCAGNANFTYDGNGFSVTRTDSANDVSTAFFYYNNTLAHQYANAGYFQLYNNANVALTQPTGVYSDVENLGSGTMCGIECANYYAYLANWSPGVAGTYRGYYTYVDGDGDYTQVVGNYVNFFSMGTVPIAYGYYVTGGAGTLATLHQYYGAEGGGTATNAYLLWGDSAGVYRVRYDNTFNSVYQAIPALYNPQITKYTPGAANYERCIPGCQWESNVATYTTEKGGTGTLRAMNLGDTGVQVKINSQNITLAGALTTSGANALTLTTTGATNVTFPTSGTLLTTAGSGTSLTFPGSLSIASGKTLTASNTLTFTGTDSSSVAFGAGGTVLYTSTATTLAAGTSVSLTAPKQYFICTSTCTVTPPVPVAGYEFCVMNDDNVATVITMAALGSSARYEVTARSSYGTASTGTMVSGGAIGDKVCIVGRDSTHYLTSSYGGVWTVN